MLHPPYVLHGSFGSSDLYNYVVPASSNVIVSRDHIPPYGYEGKPNYHSYNYGYMAPPSQGIPNHQILVHPYMGHMGGGYYPTSQGYGLYHNQPYENQPLQGTWNPIAQPREPFLATLNLPDLLNLTNNPSVSRSDVGSFSQ